MTIIREYDGYYLSCDICTDRPRVMPEKYPTEQKTIWEVR